MFCSVLSDILFIFARHWGSLFLLDARRAGPDAAGPLGLRGLRPGLEPGAASGAPPAGRRLTERLLPFTTKVIDKLTSCMDKKERNCFRNE